MEPVISGPTHQKNKIFTVVRKSADTKREAMGKKGSQLQRFKQSLAAIARPTAAHRKKRSFSDKDPERAEKLKQIEGQFNAFDTKFARPKHEVFGRKGKGTVSKPGVSKDLSEQKVFGNLDLAANG
jgi:hypothetical protein